MRRKAAIEALTGPKWAETWARFRDEAQARVAAGTVGALPSVSGRLCGRCVGRVARVVLEADALVIGEERLPVVLRTCQACGYAELEEMDEELGAWVRARVEVVVHPEAPRTWVPEAQGSLFGQRGRG